MRDNKMKRQSKEIILNAIMRMGRSLNKYPYYFVNEEDIRSELYHKLSTHFRRNIHLVCNGKEIGWSNAIHSDAVVIDERKKQHKPDLLIYYTPKKIPVELKNGRLHFFAKSTQCSQKICKHIKKRRIIEIKISKHELRGKGLIFPRIERDFDKRVKIDFERMYLIFVDRGAKIDDDIKKKVSELTKQDSRCDIIYIGCPVEERKRRVIYWFKHGKVKKL